MKNILTSAPMVCFFISSVFACSHAEFVGDSQGLILEIRLNNKIYVSLKNKSNGEKVTALPLNVVIDDSGSGVEYVITDSLNKRYNLCSNVNPVRATEAEILKPGGSAEIDYTLRTIARMYCLDSGKYKIKAIYHNTIDRQNKISIESNSIDIYIAIDAAFGRK